MQNEKVVDSFLTQSKDQRVVRIDKIQSYSASTSLSGAGSLPGSFRFATSQGEDVNQIDDKTFEIVWLDRDENEVLTRI